RDLHSFPTRRSSDLVLELQGWDSRWPFRLRRSSPRRLPRFLFLPALSRHTTQYRCCWHVQKQRIQKSATQHRLCLDRQKSNSVRSEEHTSELQSRGH